MKFDCGMTYGEKVAAKHKWHKWFAWYPVRLGTSHDCRWLETIERKFDSNYVGSTTHYREIEDAS